VDAEGIHPPGRIHVQHLIERAHVEPSPRRAFAIAEQVRRFLGEPDRPRPLPKLLG